MNIGIVLNIAKVVLKGAMPKILGGMTGLAGYNDSGKTGSLAALMDGSKFATLVVIVLGLGVSLLPADVRSALIEAVNLFAIAE